MPESQLVTLPDGAHIESCRGAREHSGLALTVDAAINADTSHFRLGNAALKSLKDHGSLDVFTDVRCKEEGD